MHKGFIKAGAISGALAVAFGAFGAHSLKKILSQDNLQIFETGVRYQFFHVFALLATGILFKEFGRRNLKWAGNCFILGIILFSGSLYALSFIKQFNYNWEWIGAVTPVGGAAFIIGWTAMALAMFKNKSMS